MIRDALLDAFAVLFPVECSGCGVSDRALCGDCRTALIADVTLRTAPGGLPVHTALRYEGVVRRVILAYKDHARTDATAVLARAAAAAVASALVATAETAAFELLSIPTSGAAYRRRGYDPVARLLSSAGLPRARVLVRGRSTGIQKSLGADQRAENLRGAFMATRSLAGRRFVLVDDVLTTGATLAEAARAVTEAGGEVVGAATLAFTPRLLPFRDKSVAEGYGE